MALRTCIRKEVKNKWERRAPLTPRALGEIVSQGIPILVERSPIRIFTDEAYRLAGAGLCDTCEGAEFVVGIKEPEIGAVRPGQVHLAFSHTIKGQPYNMALLRRFLEKGATLIDYEAIRRANGQRSIAFGRYAGIAGAIDTLYVAGRKLAIRGRRSFTQSIRQTHHYGTIARLEQRLSALARPAGEDLRILIVGTGNVGKGCEDVCRWLHLPRLNPDEVLNDPPPRGCWYAVLSTSDIVRHKQGAPFDVREYREHGAARYDSHFQRFLGRFDILLQAPYWDDHYPRQLTRVQLRRHRNQLPLAIGDISCDIEGSLACTLKITTIDQPAFTYLVDTHQVRDEITWDGPTVMAIDHLPCELAHDASRHFSSRLKVFIPQIARIDLQAPLEHSGLSPELLGAVIVYKGRLTRPFLYLEEHLARAGMAMPVREGP